MNKEAQEQLRGQLDSLKKQYQEVVNRYSELGLLKVKLEGAMELLASILALEEKKAAEAVKEEKVTEEVKSTS